MITMIKTVWKLLQVVAACLVTMLLLSWGIPKYFEWRESNSVPPAVVRVEDALYRLASWTKEKLGSPPSAGWENRPPEPINKGVSSKNEILDSTEYVAQDPAGSRYDRSLDTLKELQSKLYRE